MKYVMFELDIAGVRKNVPIIFPDVLVHDLIAKAMKVALEAHEWQGAKPVSAGSVVISAAHVGGDSESMSLKSRGIRDMRIIDNYDVLHGIE